MICPECGAAYAAPEDNCEVRFERLLALDHSRQEPWGSRHGLAFAAFALQHPDRYEREILRRGWLFLYAVFVLGHDPAAVARGLRRAGKAPPGWDIPALPEGRPKPPFPVTIADLGAFCADTYGETVDAWCRASLNGWGIPSSRFHETKRSFSAGTGKRNPPSGGGA